MKIILFVPVYNCEEQIVRVIKQIDSRIINNFHKVLIVDNVSKDGTLKRAVEAINNTESRSKFLLVQNNENYGLGGSHKVAFDFAVKAKADWICILHGDDQGNIFDFENVLLGAHDISADAILGSRFLPESKLDGYSAIRIAGNKIFNLLFSIVLLRKISDLGSGLNLVKTASLKKFDYHKLPNDLTFNYAFLVSLYFSNCAVQYKPIIWRETDQISNLKIGKQILEMLRMLIVIIFYRAKFNENRTDQILRNSGYKVIIGSDKQVEKI